MKHLIRPLLLALAALLVTGAAHKAHAQTKVAYVDLQRALMQTEEGKAAKARLKREFDKRQRTLDASQADLRQKVQNLQKQSAAMDPEVRGQKEAELQQEFMQLQQTYQTLQKELSEQEQQLTDQIFGNMESILVELVKAKGYDMVLEKNAGVLWAKEGLDLTDELVKRYNARHSGKGGGK